MEKYFRAHQSVVLTVILTVLAPQLCFASIYKDHYLNIESGPTSRTSINDQATGEMDLGNSVEILVHSPRFAANAFQRASCDDQIRSFVGMSYDLDNDSTAYAVFRVMENLNENIQIKSCRNWIRFDAINVEEMEVSENVCDFFERMKDEEEYFPNLARLDDEGEPPKGCGPLRRNSLGPEIHHQFMDCITGIYF